MALKVNSAYKGTTRSPTFSVNTKFIIDIESIVGSFIRANNQLSIYSSDKILKINLPAMFSRILKTTEYYYDISDSILELLEDLHTDLEKNGITSTEIMTLVSETAASAVTHLSETLALSGIYEQGVHNLKTYMYLSPTHVVLSVDVPFVYESIGIDYTTGDAVFIVSNLNTTNHGVIC